MEPGWAQEGYGPRGGRGEAGGEVSRGQVPQNLVGQVGTWLCLLGERGAKCDFTKVPLAAEWRLNWRRAE